MSFREDDTSFSLSISPLISEQELSKGFWLVLVGINEIPPHIALLNEGKYYSLSTSKVNCGSPVEKLLTVFERKNIPAVFILIEAKARIITISESPQTPKGALNSVAQSPFRGLGLDIEAILLRIYKDLPPLGNNEKTCLSPIKGFFAEYYSPAFAEVNYVFELLALAENKGIINKCLSLNNENPGSNHITLPKYTMIQITNKISILSDKILNLTS